MAIRLSGILRDPFGNTSPRTSIQVTSVTTFGDTLMSAVAVHQTNDNGQYDFNVVAGRHKVEVRYQYEYVKVGDFFVGSDQTGTFTISQAMDLVTPPSDPALAEMRRILTEVNNATLGLDDAVLAASQSAQQAANSVTLIGEVVDQTQTLRDEASTFAGQAEASAKRAEAAAENAEGGGAVGGGVNISIAGQSYAVRGRFTTWEITDFDEFSPYQVESPEGTTAVIDDRFLTILVPDDFVGDNIAFSITRDTFSRAFGVRVLDVSIEKPRILSPVFATENVTHLPTIVATEFNPDPLTVIHTQSEWQISVTPTFETTVLDTGLVGASSQLNVKGFIPTGLLPNQVYFVRVRYHGVENGQVLTSEWSNASNFLVASTVISSWQKTASFPLTLNDNLAKQSIKIGDFLFVVTSDNTGSAVWSYDRTGTRVDKRIIPEVRNLQDLSEYRLTALMDKDDLTGGKVAYISMLTPSGSFDARVFVVSVSGATGFILSHYATDDSFSYKNTSEINQYKQTMLIPQIYEGVAAHHLSAPENEGYFRIHGLFSGLIPDSASPAVVGALSSNQGQILAPLRHMVGWNNVVINKVANINFITGQVILGTGLESGSNAQLPFVTLDVSPAIRDTFSHDTIVATVQRAPIGIHDGKDVALIFNPNPESPYYNARYIDFGGVLSDGDIVDSIPVQEVNKPDMSNPLFLEYAAHTLSKPDAPNESNIQIVVRLEDSIQIWEFNLGHIME